MLDAAKRVNRIRRANAWRGAVGKPRRRRSEGTGEACLLLRCAGIKEHIASIDSDILKFWLIASSYADSLGVAWAAQKEFQRYGYSSRKTAQYFEMLDSLGLIRFVRKGEKDPVTRRALPNVYQFNPALVYVRKALRPAAAALSPVPFESRFSKPILTVREEMNHNQELRINSTNQDHKPRPQTNEVQPLLDGKGQGQKAKSAESSAQNQRSSAVQKQSHSESARQRTEPPPPPTPSAPPAGNEIYRAELPDREQEQIAQKLNALTADLSLPNARYLVTAHGVAPCSSAIALFCTKGENAFRSPAGWMRRTIERMARKASKNQPDSESKIITPDEWWNPEKQEKTAWQTR